MAGNWVKDRDEKIGNQYMRVIEARCGKTKIGHAAAAKHWFVDEEGPWSEKQTAAREAMRRELGMSAAEE
jgi:hypothetical protein